MSYKEYMVQIHDNGDKKWYQNGRRHREDGPAIEYADGTKAWFQNGLLHRLDGPAIERADGRKEWIQNDERHREDGPAIEYANGHKAWYLNDKHIDCKTQEEFIKLTFKSKNSCDGKIIEVEGKKYKLVSV